MTVAIQNTVREKNSGAAQKNRVVVVGEECARVSAKYTQNQMTQICCSLFCFFFSSICPVFTSRFFVVTETKIHVFRVSRTNCGEIWQRKRDDSFLASQHREQRDGILLIFICPFVVLANNSVTRFLLESVQYFYFKRLSTVYRRECEIGK